jgi:hypothetical protein
MFPTIDKTLGSEMVLRARFGRVQTRAVRYEAASWIVGAQQQQEREKKFVALADRENG